MAEKRMLTKKVTDDDCFQNLSSSAQALYLHLNMSADDDGFCRQVNASMFKAHASVQDLEALLAARFLLRFDSGVIVIKHWRMANALRKDRYTPTAFQEELAMLDIKGNGAYTERLPDGCQMVANWLPQNSVDKNSLDKGSVDNCADAPRTRFQKPSLEEVKAYCAERKNTVDPVRFLDYYEANGWRVGKNPMKDWKAAVRTWERQGGNESKPVRRNAPAACKDYGLVTAADYDFGEV